MSHLCETTSVEGLVQLLACNFLPHGYWFYVTGVVPPAKDPRTVDTKLVEKYRIDLSHGPGEAEAARLCQSPIPSIWELLCDPGDTREAQVLRTRGRIHP